MAFPDLLRRSASCVNCHCKQEIKNLRFSSKGSGFGSGEALGTISRLSSRLHPFSAPSSICSSLPPVFSSFNLEQPSKQKNPRRLVFTHTVVSSTQCAKPKSGSMGAVAYSP